MELIHLLYINRYNIRIMTGFPSLMKHIRRTSNTTSSFISLTKLLKLLSI